MLFLRLFVSNNPSSSTSDSSDTSDASASMSTPKPLSLWNQLTFEIDLGTIPMSKTAKKQKYYVVWNGRRPGIYDTWVECSAQVHGVTGARYKAFTSRAEAEKAYQHGPAAAVEKVAVSEERSAPTHEPILESYSVDAACAGVPGPVEYRGVNTRTGKEIFREGPYPNG